MKLFKKISAAILAGVMALSMVACATTPNTVVPPTQEEQTGASSPAVVLSLLNTYRDTTHGLVDTDAIVTDADYQAKAQAFVDVLQGTTGMENVNAVWQQVNGNRAVVLNSAVQAVLANRHADAIATTDHVYVINTTSGAASVTPIASRPVQALSSADGYVFTDNDLHYSMTTTARQQLAYAGWNVGPEASDIDIGIASGTVNGQEFVVIVTTENFDFTTPDLG